MKIGVVLFGHLRSYRQTHSSFKELKKTLEKQGQVDVFCHTWDIEESVTASWWKEHKAGDLPPSNVNASEIEEKYKPVSYVIEPSRQFDDSGYNVRSTIPIAGTLSMLHSQQQAFHLLQHYSNENNVEYDVVIRSRYDLLYEIATPFSTIVNDCIAKQCLYLPTSNPYELGGCFSDVFVLGPNKLVAEYFSFVSNFKRAISDYQQKGYSEFLPELCLTSYLEDRKIDLQESTGLRIHILRMSGDKFQINSDKNFPGNGPLCFFRDTVELNKKILGDQEKLIKDNSPVLAKKYMSWIDPDADDTRLQQYADLYCGKWISISKIKRLTKKSKDNPVFNSHVMKNFFEEALYNATYSTPKKLLFTISLTAYAGYGFFFFRVLKNILFNKSV